MLEKLQGVRWVVKCLAVQRTPFCFSIYVYMGIHEPCFACRHRWNLHWATWSIKLLLKELYPSLQTTLLIVNQWAIGLLENPTHCQLSRLTLPNPSVKIATTTLDCSLFHSPTSPIYHCSGPFLRFLVNVISGQADLHPAEQLTATIAILSWKIRLFTNWEAHAIGSVSENVGYIMSGTNLRWR